MSGRNSRENVRYSVSKQVAEKLPRLLGKASVHDSAALATLARLRRGVGGSFGSNAEASAELIKLLDLPGGRSPADWEGKPTPLGRVLDDAYLVVTLVAFTRVAVREAKKGPSTFGRDMRWLRTSKQ